MRSSPVRYGASSGGCLKPNVGELHLPKKKKKKIPDTTRRLQSVPEGWVNLFSSSYGFAPHQTRHILPIEQAVRLPVRNPSSPPSPISLSSGLDE